MTTSVATPAASRSGRDAGALTGLFFAVVTIASLVVTGAFISGTRPRPSAPDAAIQRFVLDNAGVLRLQVLGGVAAAMLLALFAASLAALVRRAEPSPTGLAESTLAGGMLAAAFWAVSALMLGTLVAEQIGDSPVTVSALRRVNFLTGGAGHVVWLGVLLGSASLAAHRTLALPRWLTGAGFVSAAMSTLSLVSLAFDAFLLFIPLGRFSAVLVIAATSVLMATGRAGQVPASASVRASVLGGVGVVVLTFLMFVSTMFV